MPTTSRNRFWICYWNINGAPVEPNWMMHIPSSCYICKSEIRLEDRMLNWVTIACFHFVLCYECLDWMIWKLGLSRPASCVGCTMHHKHICTCHFAIPPSWMRRDHSSRKSSQWRSVTECHYGIKSCIYNTHSLASLFITLCRQNCGQSQTSTPSLESSKILPRRFLEKLFSCSGDFQETCFLSHDVIIIPGTHGLQVTCLCSYKGPI